jgi:hypothetical protein
MIAMCPRGVCVDVGPQFIHLAESLALRTKSR